MTSLRIRFALMALLGTLAIAIPSRTTAAKTPPVPKMRIQFFDTPNPAGDKSGGRINNHGQSVGQYRTAAGELHAWFYDPAINPNVALDLNDLVDPPEGWVIASASDINDFGAICGYLNPIGDETVRRGFVCDLSAAAPVVQMLPDSQWTYSMGYRLNEHGDVLGKFKQSNGQYGLYFYHTGLYGTADANVTVVSTYVIYGGAVTNPVGTNEAQVLGQDGATGIPFRWTRSHGFVYLTQLGTCGVYDMNDSGTLCGWTQVKVSKTSTANLPFRYTTSLQTLSGGSNGELCYVINSSGDVVTAYPPITDDHLYSDLWGLLSLNAMIDPADPNAAAWNSKSNLFTAGLNDRDATTKCGQVTGVIWWADGTEKFFVLTPILK